jgi:aminobenzoyl-glutamate utilization protein B
VLALAFLPAATAEELSPAQRQAIDWLEGVKEDYRALAGTLWENPELAIDEFTAKEALTATLEKNGFKVEHEALKGMPTSFVATWGSGKPVIGILAEFDALPGLSQQAGVLKKQPVIAGAPGQGCGHHLYGSSSVFAAIATARAMEANGIPGTVKLFGTPGEEGYSGKAFMVPAGIFDVADVMITWHPGDENGVSYGSNTARTSARFYFHGRASHAGTSPEYGRSALDAAELMSIGVQYMREHIPYDTRIHSVITAGGKAPNTVPDYTSVWYYLRQPSRKTMGELWDWMKKIAEAAAQMAQTRVEIQVMSITDDELPNKVLSGVGGRMAQLVGPPAFTAEDQAWGAQVIQAFGGKVEGESFSTEVKVPELVRTYPDVPRGSSSADTGNVAWRVPMVSFSAATWAKGTPGHSWIAVAQGKAEPTIKAGLQVSKYMAATALELAVHPEIITKAKAEHQEYVEKYAYTDLMEGVPIVSFEDLFGIAREQVPGRKAR